MRLVTCRCFAHVRTAAAAVSGGTTSSTASRRPPDDRHSDRCRARRVRHPGDGVECRGIEHGIGRSSKGLSIAVPAMTLQGDVLIAALDVRRDASLTITPPAGWTLIRRESYSSSYPMSQALYWKMAGFVEPPMYTWGFSSGTGASGGILDTRGIDSAHPVDVSSGAVAMNTKSNTAPSVTTTAPNDLVVGLFGNTGSKAVMPPADFMEYFDVHSSSGARSTTEASGFVQTTAGAVGERVAKTAGSSSTTIGQLVALRSSTPPVLVSPPLVDGTPQVRHRYGVAGSLVEP